MVKPSTQKKSVSEEKSSRAASKKEIRDTIGAALAALRLNPDQRTSFNALAAETGVSSSALYNAYKGHKTLGPAPLHSLRRLSDSAKPASLAVSTASSRTLEVANAEVVSLGKIPVVSWAQAGQATDYEELPLDWQKTVPKVLADPKAFAVQISGDSMEPRYNAGDVAYLSPSSQVSQNETVIARLEDEGVVFKIYSRKNDIVSFSSYNPAYKTFDVPVDKISWVYPVHYVMKILKK